MSETLNASALGAPLFSAVITPNHSLGRTGLIIVIGLIGTINLVSASVFLTLGAWPVSGFLGLDVLAVWLAFRAYGRQARAKEVVTLTGEELVIRRVSAKGEARDERFNPYWVRLRRHVVEDEGLVRLDIVSHGKASIVAGFLSPAEREGFAAALEAALVKARRGVPIA